MKLCRKEKFSHRPEIKLWFLSLPLVGLVITERYTRSTYDDYDTTTTTTTTFSSSSEGCTLIASPSQSPGIDEQHLNFQIISLFGHDCFLPDPVKFSSYCVMDTAFAETLIGSNDISQNSNSCPHRPWLLHDSSVLCTVTDSLLRVMWHAGCMDFFFFGIPSSWRHIYIYIYI